jgi:hypothetical protein
MNLFTADGLVWRKHRRIVGPAFNTELYVPSRCAGRGLICMQIQIGLETNSTDVP